MRGYVVLGGGKNRVLEHRMIWEQHHGPIPVGYVIHHRNHVRDDNRIENLEVMPRGEHQRFHHKGVRETKPRSAETRKKLSEARKRDAAKWRELNPPKKCKRDGCDRPVRSMGECSNHYRQTIYKPTPRVPRGKKICSIPACDRFVHGRGYCSTHYWNWWTYGDPLGHKT